MFHPDPRVGARQDFCSKLGCQKARKAEYQKRWRRPHPSVDLGRRLRQELANASPRQPRPPPRPHDPLARIPWDEIQQEYGVGPSMSIVMMCVARVVVRWLAQSRSVRERPLAPLVDDHNA